MPWPPRLSSLPFAALTSPFLVAFLLLPLLPCSPASTISYADGQPEYPSQPEVTSDRNALARFFLQSLIENEGRTRNPHNYADGEEPDDWLEDGLSSKRSNAVIPHKTHHQSSLKDVHPLLRYTDDGRGSDGTPEEEDLAILEPTVDRERVLAELLARRYPLETSELTDDDREARLDHWSRLGIGKQADAEDFIRDYADRHRTPPGIPSSLLKNKKITSSSEYGLMKRDPFGINARGFHDDVFYRDFGSFNPMKRTVRSAKPDSEEKDGGSERWNKTVESLGPDHLKALPKINGSPKRSKRSTDDASPETVEEGKEERGALKREERAADAPAESGTLASKRRPEMDSSGFHGDTFNSGFGDFWTMKRNEFGAPGKPDKRRPEMDSSGFHGDTFNSGFGDFWTMKRAGHPGKRRPEMDSSGFHGDTFSSGFGDFYTMKRVPAGSPPPWDTLSEGKRRPEMDSSGFHGDTFNSGFGDFWTMKRSEEESPSHPRHGNFKRRPEMDSSGFHGDTFNSGFGDFWTMKRNALARPLAGKRRPEMDSSGFHGDTFNSGFGDFWTMKRDGHPYGKRRPEMDSSGFHGDTFNSGFGDFWTMKRDPSGFHARARRDLGRMEAAAKRRPEMDASGFHGDTFSGGFGDFWTLKRSEDERPRWPTMERMEAAKRRPEMDSSGFHGDTFNSGFGDFWTMKRGHVPQHASFFRGAKRRPEMDSSGFHGDTFNSGFGDFWTMKRGNQGAHGRLEKRRPEMDSSGFHGDTFNSGFGDFWTMKRSVDSGEAGSRVEETEESGAEEGYPKSVGPGMSKDERAGSKTEKEGRGKSSGGKQAAGGPVGGSPSAEKFDSAKQ